MNPRKLMTVVLCVTACATSVFAEDDFGIESASPTKISDPVNPQPGMMFRAYNVGKFMNADGLKGSVARLPTIAAVKTMADKGEEFSLKQIGKSDANAGMWTGFLKCKRAGIYTLTLTQSTRITRGTAGGYSLRVNGSQAVAAGWRETSVDVKLNVGWNRVDLVCQFSRMASALTISYKPKDSMSDPRPLTPGMMFYDKKPEEDW